MTTTTTAEPGSRRLALRTFELMATGTREEFAEALHPAFFNHEQVDEPPETRGPGSDQTYGVALWLRGAYADLDWTVHEVVQDGDLVVAHCTMTGRHAGPFVAYDREGRVAEAFAPTGRRFASTQSHWMRMVGGRMIEHWANRDDFGAAEQLGWVPPSPAYLVRCALAKRQARRAAAPPRAAEVRPLGVADEDQLEGIAATAVRSVHAMTRLDPAEMARLYHPDARNREAVAEPAACRGRGPEAFLATARWLAGAFPDFGFTVHHVVAEGDLVAIHGTMAGRQTGPIAFYDEHARIKAVMPPTGRSFAVTQTHWLRCATDGRVIEHWANRDDLGMAQQLGWVPPTPRYLARMALAKRRLGRTERG